MAFNESILIKNLLVVSLRGKSQAFIDSYNWDAQSSLASDVVGSRDTSTTDKNPLSPSLTPAFLSVFFTGRLSAGFHCSYSLHSYKTRGLLLSSTYIPPPPLTKRLWTWMSHENFPYVREGWGLPWSTVLSEANKIKDTEIPKEKVEVLPQKKRHFW